MASGFLSDTVRNSLHLPAPSYTALCESFPNLCSPDDHPSEPSPVNPYDLSLWQPSSDISVAPQARDGEFECFLLDDMARRVEHGYTAGGIFPYPTRTRTHRNPSRVYPYPNRNSRGVI
jgi:hypothetical protein